MTPLDALFASVSRYETLDPLETVHRDSFLALLSSSPESLGRNHFAPGHVTASGFVIDPPTRRVLLHHHRRLGRWLQMGGHLDLGETVEAAALREAAEESGLTDLRFFIPGILDLDVHDIPVGKGEPPHQHFDVRFLLATGEPERALHDESESLALGWFSLGEADALMGEPESARVLRKIALILS